ncbi:MAG: cytochrome c class [Paenibacillus sp.]|nr:cytochrome c class [Paenibacillus sp.]
MRNKFRFILTVLIIATIFVMTACGNNNNTGQQAGGTTQGGATQGGATQGGGATTANAEAIVKQNCISCHGDALDGRGNSKMDLQKVGSRLNKDQIAATIANGRNNMPAFKGKLKDEDIAVLSDWLAAKK